MPDSPSPSSEHLERGRTLYDAREEYPLLVEAGVQDYIFYYGDNDGYQQSARAFLDRIYPRHAKVVVQSLAALIDRLHTDVTRPNNPVQRIREVMIVGHASVHLMFLDIFPVPPQGQETMFRTINGASLFELQRMAKSGGTAVVDDLEAKRKVVVARMTEESWVAFRGCRFGQGRQSLFALYAFFGGRANLYAPKTYMFFVRNLPIGPNQRFKGEADVYEHMAAQRLVRPRSRTPLRQLSLVNLVSEPGHYSRDAIVRSTTISDGGQDAADYLADIASLETGNVPQSIRTALATEFDIAIAGPMVELGQEDSERALEGGFRTRTFWRFRTPLSNNFDIHEPELNYRPSEVFAVEVAIEDVRLRRDDETAELIVYARVVERGDRDAPQRTDARIDMQLFLESEEHAALRGYLLTVAARSEDAPAPDELTAYSAIEADLDAAAATPEAVHRLAELIRTRADLTEAPDDLVVEAGVDGQGLLRIWPARFGGKSYRFIRDVDTHADGRRLRDLSLFEDVGPPGSTQRLRHVFGLLASKSPTDFGTDPDVPGVELMAYLDRQSISNVEALIDFLDSVQDTRRIEFAHTWRHAVDALSDKHPHRRPVGGGDNGDPLFFGHANRYSSFYRYESNVGDFLTESNASYQFPSRRHWAQAKEVRFLATPVVADLFSAQDLPNPPDWLRDEATGVLPEPDSPSLEGRDLTPREREILNSVAGERKFARLPTEDVGPGDCEIFRTWLDRLMTLETLPESELEAVLAALPEVERPQEGNVIKLAIKGWGLFSTFFDRTPLTVRIATAIVVRFPRIGTVTFAGLTLPRLAGAANLLGTLAFVGLYFLRNWAADVAQASLESQRAGAQYAFRAYARDIGRILGANNNEFPETISVNILPAPGEDIGNHATLVGRDLDGYVSGSIHISHSAIVEPRNLGIGFEKGALIAEEAARDALRNAEGHFNEALRKAGLQPCMIDALREVGLATPARIRGLIMNEVSRELYRAARGSDRNR